MGKRIQERLVLDHNEVALIKSLIRSDNYNDQMVQAVFSHLGRTINHREIGFIRKNHLKYAHIEPANDLDRINFLVSYRRAIITMKRTGAMPCEPFFGLLVQAREAMLAAISIFNNPNINFKTEIYVTNSVIAWTYLLHAYYLNKGVTYQYSSQTTRGGQPKYFELGACVRLPECPLDVATVANLEYLLELRHEIEHRMAEDIDPVVSSKIQSCALNFDHYLGELFGDEYRINASLPYSIQLSEISIAQRRAMKSRSPLPNVIQVVNKAIEEGLTDEQRSDLRYAYRVYLIPKTSNRGSGADEAIEFIHPSSEKGEALQIALKEVEKRKLLPSSVVKQMRAEGYRWFRQYELTQFVRSLSAKDPAKRFGVELGGRWFWYEHFLDLVRKYCENRRKD